MVEINQMDIIGTLEHDGGFTSLLRAIRDAGLEETLKGAGPFTVFAPEDAAFESAQTGAMRWIGDDTTRARLVLTHHVVKDRLLVKDLMTARPLRALDGSDLQLRPLGAKARVDEATIVRPDIVAKNGVIHAIDRVIIEPQVMAQRQK
ncbi:MAG: fasciclin domain-containing protein [Methanospirillum sp.]